MSRGAHSSGPLATLAALVRTVAAVLRVRLELATVEAGQARGRLALLAACALSALLLLFLALVLGSLLVVASLWDTPYRLLAAAAVTAVPAVAGLALALACMARARAGLGLFGSTLAALDADLAALQ